MLALDVDEHGHAMTRGRIAALGAAGAAALAGLLWAFIHAPRLAAAALVTLAALALAYTLWRTLRS
jgi:membrane protease YdiL (CAAX protease family)